VLGVFVLAAASGRLGASSWAPYGPSGGSIQSLAVDPSSPATVYAGTFGGGLFRSAYGG
jgi:hypothetical protein